MAKVTSIKSHKDTVPNGSVAFEMAMDMERDLRAIHQCGSTLLMFKQTMDSQHDINVIDLVIDTLFAAFRSAEEKRDKISDSTWGFRQGPAARSA